MGVYKRMRHDNIKATQFVYDFKNKLQKVALKI